MTRDVGMLAVGILLLLIGSLEATDEGAPSGESPGISGGQRRDLVRIHNELRRLERAADMEYMEWSERLANLSLITANDCIFRLDQSARVEMTSQNMAIISGGNLSDMTSAVTWWYDDTYDVTNGQCQRSPTCEQHLQLIWASTNKVGCASNKCNLLFNAQMNETASNVTLFVCTYLPGVSSANSSRPPFVVGQACSQCASGAIWCDTTEPRGLCRRNCSDEVPECILIDKPTTERVPISHQNTGSADRVTSLGQLPGYDATSTSSTIIPKPNKTTRETDAANQITSTLSDASITVRPTFTRNEGLPSEHSTRTTGDLRLGTAVSGSGSATRPRSTTFSRATSVKYADGATDVSKTRTEPVFGSSSNAMMQSSANLASSSVESTTSASLTSFSTTELWPVIGGITSGAQSGANRESWLTSDWSRSAVSRSTGDAVITSSVNTERLPESTAITHTTAHHRMSTSRDSGTQTPTETSRAKLNAITSQSVRLDTTTDGVSSHHRISPDTVNPTELNRITSHRSVVPTATTSDIYISDPGEIRDIASTKSPFWLIVILVVSLDSLLFVAIIVTGVIVIKQKRDADRSKQLYEDDTESHISESKYYHFGFEGFKDEAVA